MRIRAYRNSDFDRVLDLTCATFGPFYEESFRPAVGEEVFAVQHGDWRGDYRVQVAGLHDPEGGKHLALAETGEGDGAELAGYVAWNTDGERRSGNVEILAVSAAHRRRGLASALVRHAFDRMRAAGARIAVIGTGGDDFHAPARAFYDSIGGTAFPVAVYYYEL